MLKETQQSTSNRSMKRAFPDPDLHSARNQFFRIRICRNAYEWNPLMNLPHDGDRMASETMEEKEFFSSCIIPFKNLYGIDLLNHLENLLYLPQAHEIKYLGLLSSQTSSLEHQA